MTKKQKAALLRFLGVAELRRRMIDAGIFTQLEGAEARKYGYSDGMAKVSCAIDGDYDRARIALDRAFEQPKEGKK